MIVVSAGEKDTAHGAAADEVSINLRITRPVIHVDANAPVISGGEAGAGRAQTAGIDNFIVGNRVTPRGGVTARIGIDCASVVVLQSGINDGVIFDKIGARTAALLKVGNGGTGHVMNAVIREGVVRGVLQ